MNAGPFVSPAVHGLRYNEVRFKASHNSYAKKISLEEQLTFNRDKPAERGFRGVEIDVHQDTKGCTWCVRHLVGPCATIHRNRKKGGPAKPDCLGNWLGELKRWSDKHRDHDVVTVTLDLKKVVRPESFPKDFDAVVEGSGLDRSRLFTPMQLKDQWPTLGELRGRFILCLSGLEDIKSEYSRGSDRLCFADLSLGPGLRRPAGDGRVFLNYNWRDYEKDRGNVFRKPTGRPFVVRAYSLRKDVALGSWDVAEKKGINIMATEWLRRLSVGPDPFASI